MADVNRDNRPLSPHLMVFRPMYTMILSITHRITGVGLTLGALLVVWWFLAAAIGEDAFDIANGVLTSVLGGLVLIGSLWAIFYHLCNGIRHLFWDAGRGLDLETSWRSGLVVVAASLLLTGLVLLVAIGGR